MSRTLYVNKKAAKHFGVISLGGIIMGFAGSLLFYFDGIWFGSLLCLGILILGITAYRYYYKRNFFIKLKIFSEGIMLCNYPAATKEIFYWDSIKKVTRIKKADGEYLKIQIIDKDDDPFDITTDNVKKFMRLKEKAQRKA